MWKKDIGKKIAAVYIAWADCAGRSKGTAAAVEVLNTVSRGEAGERFPSLNYVKHLNYSFLYDLSLLSHLIAEPQGLACKAEPRHLLAMRLQEFENPTSSSREGGIARGRAAKDNDIVIKGRREGAGDEDDESEGDDDVDGVTALLESAPPPNNSRTSSSSSSSSSKGVLQAEHGRLTRSHCPTAAAAGAHAASASSTTRHAALPAAAAVKKRSRLNTTGMDYGLFFN